MPLSSRYRSYLTSCAAEAATNQHETKPAIPAIFPPNISSLLSVAQAASL
jgi:hypothetical protein